MAEDFETVDGELLAPGEAPRGALAPSRPVLSPVAVQAVAVAATGVAAGAATIAVVRHRRVRRARRGRRRALGNVVASRSFLVDVHVLGDRS